MEDLKKVRLEFKDDEPKEVPEKVSQFAKDVTVFNINKYEIFCFGP